MSPRGGRGPLALRGGTGGDESQAPRHGHPGLLLSSAPQGPDVESWAFTVEPQSTVEPRSFSLALALASGSTSQWCLCLAFPIFGRDPRVLGSRGFRSSGCRGPHNAASAWPIVKRSEPQQHRLGTLTLKLLGHLRVSEGPQQGLSSLSRHPSDPSSALRSPGCPPVRTSGASVTRKQ